MHEVSLTLHQQILIDEEFQLQIVEINDNSVKIAIRSESISPYYWEQELTCEESRCLTEMMSL